ncbi:MAG: hypothetical protein Q9163_003547 [Psora crenata]
MTAASKRQKREAYRASHVSTEGNAELPQKKLYRQRAHANPFSDHALQYPTSPSEMDWANHYPAFIDPNAQTQGGEQKEKPRPLTKNVTIADIGCGFGGLLVALSPLLPEELILGLEIRTQVTTYVHDRIQALRRQKPQPQHPSSSSSPSFSSAPAPPHSAIPPYQNISVLRTNSMKFLPNFFPRASLTHIFLCFPDPHFKARKHKARIVSSTLCAEYAFVLRPGGCIWTITDVEELAGWMESRLMAFGGAAAGGMGNYGLEGQEGMFEKVEVPEEGDEGGWEDKQVGMLVRCMREETEEGKKVTRNGGKKFVSVWRRRQDPPWPGE